MSPNLVPVDFADWKWHGTPLHFIGCAKCCFHLGTTVGSVKVSTVGCYHPMASGPSEYSMENRETLSSNPESWYETMVNEGEGWGAQFSWTTEEEAERGHLAVCNNVARGRDPAHGIREESE